MLGNAIKQTTATTGTGNLTLAAVSGYPTISNLIPLRVPVDYSLLAADGTFIEAGIGYLSDASTFVRAKVHATFIGSTYNKTNPTAANLTGTTTLIVTPHDATLESMLPTVDAVSSGVNRFLASAAHAVVTTTVGLVSQRAQYIPFLLRTAARIASMAVNVTTAGQAGSIVHLGIHACNENGYPGELLAATGDIAADSTGLKVGTLVSPILIPAGWVFVSNNSSTQATGSIGVTALTSNLGYTMGGSPLGFNGMTAIDFRAEATATPAIPQTPSLSTTASNVGTVHLPMILLGTE